MKLSMTFIFSIVLFASNALADSSCEIHLPNSRIRAVIDEGNVIEGSHTRLSDSFLNEALEILEKKGYEVVTNIPENAYELKFLVRDSSTFTFGIEAMFGCTSFYDIARVARIDHSQDERIFANGVNSTRKSVKNFESSEFLSTRVCETEFGERSGSHKRIERNLTTALKKIPKCRKYKDHQSK